MVSRLHLKKLGRQLTLPPRAIPLTIGPIGPRREPQMTADNITRQAAISMVQSGEALPAEVAELAQVDRQLLHYWARNLDWRERRTAWLKRRWRRHLAAARVIDGA